MGESSDLLCPYHNESVSRGCILQFNFFLLFEIVSGRTSPYMRTSAKMKPIEESGEDDVFELPSAVKPEVQ
ncbi:hypothetical protein KIL84_017112 [Mauremys mutica]|uniref:Uncharacterized protein n=1 Tax=Mauremys mutica TaxID=74926 RepID=A0A9D3X5H8_9SAUR|nr:hypothetical protein KIL84_017112 [Mauremys mutica]